MIIKNKLVNTLILVPDGYELCPRCKGTGYHPEYDTAEGEKPLECTICEGTGIVDWISHITIGDWEKQDIEYEKSYEEECLYDEYEEEMWDMEHSSFEIEFDED